MPVHLPVQVHELPLIGLILRRASVGNAGWRPYLFTEDAVPHRLLSSYACGFCYSIIEAALYDMASTIFCRLFSFSASVITIPHHTIPVIASVAIFIVIVQEIPPVIVFLAVVVVLLVSITCLSSGGCRRYFIFYVCENLTVLFFFVP